MDLIEFLANKQRNAWIEPVEGLQIYVRAHGGQIDLANMEASEPGKGLLTSYLPEFEETCKNLGYTVIKVENILNQRLVPFFQRNGYSTYIEDCCWQAKKEL